MFGNYKMDGANPPPPRLQKSPNYAHENMYIESKIIYISLWPEEHLDKRVLVC